MMEGVSLMFISFLCDVVFSTGEFRWKHAPCLLLHRERRMWPGFVEK